MRKKVGFQMLFKKGGGCCGMMFHAFGAAAPTRLAEENINGGFVTLLCLVKIEECCRVCRGICNY